MSESTDSSYPFAGLPATPMVLGELVLELFAGQTARRADLIDQAVAAHLGRGGLEPNSTATTVMKKALQDLEASGRVEKSGVQGWWRISGEPSPTTNPETVRPGAEAAQAHRSAALHPGVYVYCYPSYRTLAEHRGETRWPVKIGMSATDMDGRIADQLGTSLPEAPVVLDRYPSETPSVLERAIHSVLTLRGQSMTEAPGAEWFMTNPDEVREIVAWIGSTGVVDEGDD